MTTECKIKPLQDRIIVERIDAETHSQGGIILPENAQEKPQIGKILALGSSKKLSDLNAGDRIIFGKYTGSQIKFEGNDYLIMREEDVLAVLTA